MTGDPDSIGRSLDATGDTHPPRELTTTGTTRRHLLAAASAAALLGTADTLWARHGGRDLPIPTRPVGGDAAANAATRPSNPLSSSPYPSSQRRIPASGRTVPSIGLGSWLTLDLEPGSHGTEQRVNVVQAFFDTGGGVIDSSPMYGHAEALIGHALGLATRSEAALFAASKIWTPIDAMGVTQMNNTEQSWGIEPMDLMQIHNLVDVPAHLPRLREWQDEGRIGHVGVTTSHGRRHDELERLMQREHLDTVQLTLNLTHREAERRLLPLAADRGMVVIVNRPLDGGRLPDSLAKRALSPLAIELGCESWAAFCLLFVVSHPAVTCAIPATRDVDHLHENMSVLSLEMPDAKTRKAMVAELD